MCVCVCVCACVGARVCVRVCVPACVCIKGIFQTKESGFAKGFQKIYREMGMLFPKM